MVMKKVGICSYLVKTNEGKIYRYNRKYLRQTAERPLDTIATVPEGAEDEATIATTAPQQTIENEPNIPQKLEVTVSNDNTLSNQTQHPQSLVIRSGRISKPPNWLEDFCQTLIYNFF